MCQKARRMAILASISGRKPYWFASRSVSKMGPITNSAAIWATRSEMAGMPSGRQGNRISDLGEELCEVGVLPAGPFDFDTQGAFGGFLGQEIKGHMAQDGEVMRAVIAAVSGIVLIHNHVQDPMQVVFDCPMGPCRVPESFRRQWRAQQVIGRLGGDLGCRFTGAGDLADGGEARPLMEFLQPSDVG